MFNYHMLRYHQHNLPNSFFARLLMIAKALSKPLTLIPVRQKFQLECAMRDATTYEQWANAARLLDELSGNDRWKAQDHSNLYDHVTIRRRLDQLRRLHSKGDNAGLVFALEEGVHGNLGNMGKPILHSKCHFGTKNLITDYVDVVVETLLHIEQLPAKELDNAIKLDLFKRASHCFGRSALMFSSGGTRMYFHFGVAKGLLDQGLLPSVLSGSSAGALTCAILGTHTDTELAEVFTPENLFFGKAWQPNIVERLTGLRRIYGSEAFEHTFERLIPDLTFREALELSGHQISISVSPCERHHSPRLLNAITSPHVLIRSAVRASCAVPGLFEPVQLLARNGAGKTVPYLKSRWVDGVFAADLPAKQLARIYGTNHYIVSYINPVLLPMFRDHKLKGGGLRPFTDMMKSSARNFLKVSDALIGKYMPASSVGLANKLMHDIVSQNYVGDISIVPERRMISPTKLVSPNTQEEIAELMREGERQTWAKMEMIRISSKISRTLDGILKRAGEDGHSGY
jgi:TAG lipase / steryl ester hydrolase / phospholipase A2 / LPA acyltransferase